MTEEEVRRQTQDAVTRAAVQNIENQVNAARGKYESMNRDTRVDEQIGRETVAGGMAQAGVDQSMSGTAGMIIGSAGGRERGKNAEAEQLLEITGETAKAQAETEGEKLQKEAAEQQAEQQKKLAEAMMQTKAETLAKYGDFSGYGEMGYTPEQVKSMKAAWDKQNPAATWSGMSGYAAQLLQIYEKNPGYDIRGSLQAALDGGLISQQDYTAAMLAAQGILPARSRAGGTGRRGGTSGGGYDDGGALFGFAEDETAGIDRTRQSGEGQLKGSAWDYTKAEVRRLLRAGDEAALDAYLQQIGPQLSREQLAELESMETYAPTTDDNVANENRDGSVRVVIDGRPMWLTPTKLLEALETGRLIKTVDENGKIVYKEPDRRRAQAASGNAGGGERDRGNQVY